ncbi:MAG: helix-turn-helix transcriptional regulator [Bdellovibrionota bacterium]
MDYECKKIQKTLKTLMKSKKATYESMAKALNTSPATIKRRLNGDDLTLKQVKDLASSLSISFYEIIELSKVVKREPHLFTVEQEKLLASDFKIQMLFRHILARVSFSDIQSIFNFSEKELRAHARALETVSLVQLLPGDRFIQQVNYPFRWQPNGALQKAYGDLILQNIFSRIESDKGQAGVNRKYELLLNEEAYKKFCEETQTIYEKYLNISEIHMETQPDLSRVVSGIFFIDRFSVWENSKKL